MQLTRPAALPPRARIAVAAISGPSDLARIEEAARNLERRGHTVTLAANIDASWRGYLAGTDDLRVAELNRLLRSPEFDAFFFARGGYGAMRVLDAIDYEAIRANPRPIVGFSDVTALHQAVALRAGVGSFHGPMLNLDWFEGLSPEIERWFWSMLAGEAPLVHHFSRSQVVADGSADGVLFGGCLSLTVALAGTPYDFWVDDGIWFFEEVGEVPYRLDRMLTHLHLSGRFRRIRGVVVGRLKDCGTAEELEALLDEHFRSRGIPVIRDLPFGHFGDNLLMPVGSRVRIDTAEGTLTIPEPAVAPRGSR